MQSLRDFEADVANRFNRGEIKAPVHLSDGNEASLLSIFQEISELDWVFLLLEKPLSVSSQRRAH